MSGAAGWERPEEWPQERPEERQRVVPPASPVPSVSGRSPPSRDPRDPHLRGISEEQRQAQEEWEALEEIQSGLGGTSGTPPPPISFSEALQHFQSAELPCSRVRPGSGPAPRRERGAGPCPAPGRVPERSGLLSLPQGSARAPARRGILAALLRCLCGPPRLRPQLRGEQELALAMAQCALDDSERVHMRILQTIYRQLTRSRLGCPRYGAHWEELGFQGADPGTDLRGTGMLGLMQILFFVLDSRTLPLAREIFQLSQHETQNFPFCIMSVNITRIVIQALQEERLSRECNRRQQVIAVLNDLYAAAFLRLSRLWEQQHGTVASAGFFLKELELSTKKKPRQLLKSLEAYLSRGLRPPSPPSSQIHFSSICDPGVELEGDA
ncbi:ELMO domain-containing protein 3 [Ammospiza maritima maritima]